MIENIKYDDFKLFEIETIRNIIRENNLKKFIVHIMLSYEDNDFYRRKIIFEDMEQKNKSYVINSSYNKKDKEGYVAKDKEFLHIDIIK